VVAPSGKFLCVDDRLSNQVSEYKVAAGTGVLTANSQATISTASNPVWAAIRVGTTIDATTGGTKDYLYVAELGASSLSIYTFDSTKGTLGRVGQPITIDGGQPSALAAE
jgi:6-phosphogluconolactonase (cycloisomerase 2 family)